MDEKLRDKGKRNRILIIAGYIINALIALLLCIILPIFIYFTVTPMRYEYIDMSERIFLTVMTAIGGGGVSFLIIAIIDYCTQEWKYPSLRERREPDPNSYYLFLGCRTCRSETTYAIPRGTTYQNIKCFNCGNPTLWNIFG